MSLCPVCEQKVSRRIKLFGEMVCRHCYTALEKVDGEWYAGDRTPPVARLEKILREAINSRWNKIYPYVIPHHMSIRAKRILKDFWYQYYIPVEEYLDAEEVIHCYTKSVNQLIEDTKTVELGLLLWYISGKETNKFRGILAEKIEGMIEIKNFNAEPDHWLD